MFVILTTCEAESGRMRIQSQHRQKFSKTSSQPIAGCGSVPLSSQATWEAKIRRIEVPGQHSKKVH
jgi:hypothetical protein